MATNNPFAKLISPFLNQNKKTTATGDKPVSPYSILSTPPGRSVSPFNIPQRSSGPQMTPLPQQPNMSTPSGPAVGVNPNFSINRAVPEVKNETPQAPQTPPVPQTAPPVVNPAPEAPTASTRFTTPSGAVIDAQGNVLSGPPAGTASTGTPATPAVPDITPETASAIKQAEDAIANAMKVGDEELKTQADIDKLIESTKKAFLNTSDQPIPLEFITGQLKSIENRALGLAEPLEAKLARMQGKRTSALESSRFSLERADKKAEAERSKAGEKKDTDTFIDENNNVILYDTQTGKEIANLGPQAGAGDEGFTLSEGQIRYDADGNVIARGTPKKGTGAGGTSVNRGGVSDLTESVFSGIIKLEDLAPTDRATVAAEISASGRADEFGRETASKVIAAVDALLNDPQVDKAPGFNSIIPAIPGTAKFDFERKFNNLSGLLTLENLGLMSGVLSDSDIKILQNAATALSLGQSEKAFKDELNNIKNSLLNTKDEDPEVAELRKAGYSEEQIQQIING